jgi:hypothetical protein
LLGAVHFDHAVVVLISDQVVEANGRRDSVVFVPAENVTVLQKLRALRCG